MFHSLCIFDLNLHSHLSPEPGPFHVHSLFRVVVHHWANPFNSLYNTMCMNCVPEKAREHSPTGVWAKQSR